MDTTDPIEVTSTPLELVADQSLAEGSYTVQNVGSRDVFLTKRSAIPTPSTAGAHVLGQRVFMGITVDAGDAFYVWTAEGQVAQVVLTGVA